MDSLHQLLAGLVAVWLGKLLKGKKYINKLLGIIGVGWGWDGVEGSKPIEYYKKPFLLLQPYPRAPKQCISEEACF